MHWSAHTVRGDLDSQSNQPQHSHLAQRESLIGIVIRAVLGTTPIQWFDGYDLYSTWSGKGVALAIFWIVPNTPKQLMGRKNPPDWKFQSNLASTWSGVGVALQLFWIFPNNGSEYESSYATTVSTRFGRHGQYPNDARWARGEEMDVVLVRVVVHCGNAEPFFHLSIEYSQRRFS